MVFTCLETRGWNLWAGRASSDFQVLPPLPLPPPPPQQQSCLPSAPRSRSGRSQGQEEGVAVPSSAVTWHLLYRLLLPKQYSTCRFTGYLPSSFPVIHSHQTNTQGSPGPARTWKNTALGWAPGVGWQRPCRSAQVPREGSRGPQNLRSILRSMTYFLCCTFSKINFGGGSWQLMRVCHFFRNWDSLFLGKCSVLEMSSSSL